MAFRDGYHREDILSLWKKKRVKFGEFCSQHDYCPLMLDTLCQKGALERRFRGAVEIDWKDLEMGRATIVNGKRLRGKDASIEIMSPWKPNARQKISVSVVDVRLKEPSGSCAKLYHSKKDGKLFALDVFSEACDEDSLSVGLDAIRKGLDARFSEGFGPVCQKFQMLNLGTNGCETVVDRHRELEAKVGAGLLDAAALCVRRRVLRDNGVSRVVVEGFVEEMIHGLRTARISVTDLGSLKNAWSAGGGESCPIVVDVQDSPLENIPSPSGEESSAGYSLAWVARVYEFGLYGVAPEDAIVEKMYRKAAAVGNVAASRWKSGRAKSCMEDDSSGLRLAISSKKVIGTSISILTFGWDSEDWLVPLFWGMEKSSVSPMDNVHGMQVGIVCNECKGDGCMFQFSCIGNLTRRLADVSGLQCSGIMNIEERCSHFFGWQLAGFANVAECTARMCGVQTASLLNGMADKAELSGVQMAMINSGYALCGGQVGCWNWGQSVSGVQLGAGANVACEADGVQIAGIVNAVWRRFDAFDGGVGGPSRIALHASGAANVRGIQLAAGGNFAEGHMTGVQIGMINWAESMSGLQIGLLNHIGDAPVKLLPIVNWNF